MNHDTSEDVELTIDELTDEELSAVSAGAIYIKYNDIPGEVTTTHLWIE
jgi:hypothetical protein